MHATHRLSSIYALRCALRCCLQLCHEPLGTGPTKMSSEDTRTSFVTRAFRRLAWVCRRFSHGESAASVTNGSDEPQQLGGDVPLRQSLPALPTHSQLLQGGARLVYRQRGPEECEAAVLPGSWAPAEQPVQVRIRNILQYITSGTWRFSCL